VEWQGKVKSSPQGDGLRHPYRFPDMTNHGAPDEELSAVIGFYDHAQLSLGLGHFAPLHTTPSVPYKKASFYTHNNSRFWLFFSKIRVSDSIGQNSF